MSEVEQVVAREAVELARNAEVCSFLELAVIKLKNMGWEVDKIQGEVWDLYHGINAETQ